MFGENSFMEKRFFERLAALRQQKNVSAREMSLALGQSESYINNIENGHSFPSMSVFFYICDYLGVTPAEFFEANNKNPRRVGSISEKLKQLNEDQLSLIESMLNNMK